MGDKEKNVEAAQVEDLNPLLKFAAIGGVVQAIQNRVARGDCVNGQDKDGFTALMYAVRRGNDEAVKALLLLNASVAIKNKINKTALDIAAENGFHRIVDLLKGEPSLISSPDSDNLGELFHGDFDLGGWEVDEGFELPKHNGEIYISVDKTHKSITAHQPIDRDSDWNDIYINIPVLRRKKERLTSSDKFLLRKIIYQGYRDGFISLAALEEISLDHHLELDLVLLDTLILFIQDLELKIIECPFELDIDYSDEGDVYLEDIIEQLLYLIDNYDVDERWFYDNLSAPLSGGQLLSHDDEIGLGKVIEAAYSNCLELISSSRDALNVIVSDLRKICDGSIDRHEILHEKLNLGNPNLNLEKLETIDDSMEALADVELSDQNDDLVKFTQIINCSDKLDSSKVLLFLHDLNINFKYLQALVFEKRITDSNLLSHIEIAIKARNRLVTSNLRLANHVARSYRYTDLPYTDLVQEAFIGLIKAAERFEYKRGFRFTTYATWWIRQSVGRMVQDKSRLIRLPVHIGELVNKFERLEKKLIDVPASQRVGEIAKILGISDRRAHSAKNAIFSNISIDSDDEFDINLLESYDFPMDIRDLEMQQNSALRNTFEVLFLKLEKKDVEIIKRRFGWVDGNSLTLEEVGELYGVTRERIRQIEAKAMKKLRNSYIAGI